jgi:hypothetical protein
MLMVSALVNRVPEESRGEQQFRESA